MADVVGHQIHAARFWAKVDKKESGCWEWTGHRTKDGYGRFSLHGRCIPAARYACQLARRHLRLGEVASFTCQNPSCVNPDHIEIITRSQANALHANRPPHPKMVLVRYRTSECADGKRYRILTWTTPKQAQKLRMALQGAYKTRMCQTCGKLVSHFYTRAKYCSKTCRDDAYAKRRKPRGPCRRCGNPVPYAPRQAPGRMYCSRTCLNAARGEFLLFVNPFRRQNMLTRPEAG